MDRDCVISTPVDDYELLDFGGGRKLERFGIYVVDRPEPLAFGFERSIEWEADWQYRDTVVAGEWRPSESGLPREWSVMLAGVKQFVQLGNGGELGVQPGQMACWQWMHERLSGCYHMEDIQVLVLFGGSGGATAAAIQAGAEVTHVDGDADAIACARRKLKDRGVRWVHDDVNSFVDHALRQRLKYDMVILRPPALQRGPHQQSWDIYCGDLESLATKLPRLISEHCRGIWLSPRIRGVSTESLEALLREVLPGRTTVRIEPAITTRGGRALPLECAAGWFDDEEFLRGSENMPSMDAARVEEQLDTYLEPVLSSRRTATGPAQQLSRFERGQQEFVLRWVEIIARTNAEMAFQFAVHAARALELMNEPAMEGWIIQAMDAYDKQGLHAGVAEFREVERFASEASQRDSGIVLDDVAGVLDLFIQGLNGRRLKLASADTSYTDSATLWLPAVISRFPVKEDNFRCYKAMAVFQWAQTWFGTYRVSVEEALAEFDDYQRALEWFAHLECIRLSACIARELPGLHREVSALSVQLGEVRLSAGWQELVACLQHPGADVRTSLQMIAEVYASPMPAPVYYQGVFKPEQVEKIKAERLAREKKEFRSVLARLLEDSRRRKLEAGNEETDSPPQFEMVEKDRELSERSHELLLDGQLMEIQADAKNLISSILQDLGEIPPEYLQAAGDGAYHYDTDKEDKSTSVWQGTYHEEGAFLYNEWDYSRKHYRKNWCVLREVEVASRGPSFVNSTLQKYSGLVKNIRHTFEALRGEDKILKKQPYGDDLDIDAIVEAYGDVHGGLEMSDRLFTKKHKLERNIAVMFMVDMSGSTKGWINDAERESLVLLCEALQILGDRYAIYGFSGVTRKRCELFRVKDFDEPYSDEVKGRISGIEARDYTRMGVTIRHLTSILNQVEARTRLLITLSDGKPDDYDGYRGEYGIEDTRMALIEAKRDGIHPFCITIDREANDYLPHMYGAVNYTVIDEVRKLPLKVSDIYRQLTT